VLKELNLSGNFIGDEGITELCEGLKGSAVTSLDLRYNGLGNQDKQAIKDAAGSGIEIHF